jgi:hypothetical protein
VSSFHLSSTAIGHSNEVFQIFSENF